jgi:hypothetical protein
MKNGETISINQYRYRNKTRNKTGKKETKKKPNVNIKIDSKKNEPWLIENIPGTKI